MISCFQFVWIDVLKLINLLLQYFIDVYSLNSQMRLKIIDIKGKQLLILSDHELPRIY